MGMGMGMGMGGGVVVCLMGLTFRKNYLSSCVVS
jgi:hypothetical protein